MQTPLWMDPELLARQGSLEYELAHEAAEFATHVLWALSGRRYTGVVTTTETYEYVASDATMSLVSSALSQRGTPVLTNGVVINTAAGSCSCHTTGHAHLRLRGFPVQSVSSVVVNGSAVDRADYWLENRSVLSLKAPSRSNEICTAVVTYSYGTGIPAAGRSAAAQLARELFNAGTGGECALPDRVTSVTREGMSFTLLDNQDFLNDLRTGVYQVDLFLRAVNPDKARRPSRVFVAGMPRARKVIPGTQLDPLALSTVQIT